MVKIDACMVALHTPSANNVALSTRRVLDLASVLRGDYAPIFEVIAHVPTIRTPRACRS